VRSAKTAELIEMSFEELTYVGPRKYVVDWGSNYPTKTGSFEGDKCRPIITYLTQANVSAQRKRQTNAFAVARGDKTTMRPLAKLYFR